MTTIAQPVLKLVPEPGSVRCLVPAPDRPPRPLTPAKPRPTPVGPGRAPTACVGLAIAILEALSGRRSLTQLEPHTSLRVHDLIAAHARRGGLRGARVASLHTQMATRLAAEVSARVALASGGRSIAVAMRLQRRGRGWWCGELTVITPGVIRARPAA